MRYRIGTGVVLLLALSNGALAEQPTGEKLYVDNCAICHAAGELGTMVLSRRLGNERAVLIERDDLPAEYVRHVVRHGFGGMPPFTRGDVTDSELAAIVDFLVRRP